MNETERLGDRLGPARRSGVAHMLARRNRPRDRQIAFRRNDSSVVVAIGRNSSESSTNDRRARFPWIKSVTNNAHRPDVGARIRKARLRQAMVRRNRRLLDESVVRPNEPRLAHRGSDSACLQCDGATDSLKKATWPAALSEFGEENDSGNTAGQTAAWMQRLDRGGRRQDFEEANRRGQPMRSGYRCFSNRCKKHSPRKRWFCFGTATTRTSPSV